MSTRKLTRSELQQLGRTRWTTAIAQAALAEQEASGESVAAFARRHGLHPQRLLWWRSRLDDWQSASGGSVPLLVPAVAPAQQSEPTGNGGPQVRLRVGGLEVEVTDTAAVSPGWLAALVRELGGAQ